MRLLLAALALVAAAGITACASGGFFRQAPQTYNVTVTATSTSATHTAGFSVTVE